MQQTDPILVESIAKRLQEIRERHKHTKEFVLHGTCLAISDYERKVKSLTLASIARFCLFYNISLDELFEAYWTCRRKKSRSRAASLFEADYEHNLIELREEINAGIYAPRASRAFVITRPDVREIHRRRGKAGTELCRQSHGRQLPLPHPMRSTAGPGNRDMSIGMPSGWPPRSTPISADAPPCVVRDTAPAGRNRWRPSGRRRLKWPRDTRN